MRTDALPADNEKVSSAAYAEFRKAYPEYETTHVLDTLRASEYRRLDEAGHVYLDYTGGGLHAESQIREHAELLSHGVFGNPHSASLTSSGMTSLVEQARRAVLTWFNAGNDYTAVFTQNATAALKQVGESYPFAPGGRYLLTVDNHNSVNGIREFACAKGATVAYAPLTTPELRIASALANPSPGRIRPRTICSRTPPSQISPGSSIRSSSWTRRTLRGGTCCWTPQPLSPRIGSTCRP
jgi:molybdenum cofactor sulfurtransferase